MSDYNNPNSYDKYGNPLPGDARPYAYEPADANGRAPYVLLGLLVLVGIVGGAMYFNGGTRKPADVAQAPPAMTDTRPAPAAPMNSPSANPTITAPAPTATTPAPAAPATTQQ